MATEQQTTTMPKLVMASVQDEAQTESGKRREMIKAAVDAAANGVMTDIKALRGQLDELEQLVLQNAARVTENLNTHVSISESAHIEVHRLSGIVAEMKKTQIENAGDVMIGKRH